MNRDRDVHLTAAQALHERIMRELVARVQDTTFVLKGGSALAFAYGLNRHSTDLDFDADRRTDISRRIRRSMLAVGVTPTTWWHMDKRNSLRYRVEYIESATSDPEDLTVDMHFKPKPKQVDVVMVGGIQTYRVPALFEQKLDAANDRREPRDLYDLAFIAKRFGDRLTDQQVRRADALTMNLDWLERKFAKRFERDPVLRPLTTVDATLIELRDAVEVQLQRRHLAVQEQRVPISTRIGRTIIELRKELHGPEHLEARRISHNGGRLRPRRRSLRLERELERDIEFGR